MKLYKYTKKEHMKSLFESGSVRIGTLYDYNNEDKYGSMTGDASDGVKFLEGKLNGTFTSDEAKSHPAVPSIISGGGVTFFNCSVKNMRINSQNLFIFSTSLLYTFSFL